MNKSLSVVLFALGVLFLLYAIFGRYLVLPGYLATLEQGQSTLADASQTVSAWKVIRYLLWAYAFKLGMWLLLLGAAFRSLSAARRWLITLGGLVYIAFAYAPIPAPPSLMFGLAGGVMTVLMVGAIVQWGNGRSHLTPLEQRASDYRMAGYFFFGMATYTLCPLLGVKTFALSPEKMIAYGLQGEAASFAFHLLIELLLGWLFIALSLHPTSVTAPSRKGVLRNLTGILAVLLLVGCGGPSAEELETVDYAPLSRSDWEVSTPEAEGLEPRLVAELYYDAGELETIYSVLVVKNGRLIAEGYFNEGSVAQKALVQSATKSVTSALVGITLDQGCLSSIDQKMFAYFPEYADQITDSRKRDITIQDMLQMRAGFPPEESDQTLWEAVWSGDYDHLVVDFPLTYDPGEAFQYSNLTAHWLGIIVARSCDTDLETLGQEHLFSPLGAEVGSWRKDLDGYNWGAGELHLTARDAAKFGLLYLQDGEFAGNQIIPAEWVHNSLQTYSENAYADINGFRDIGYGYQWWSATVGDYPVNFAWGHGGQLIVLVNELDMVVVVTADPFYEVYGSQSWKHEKANFELVADFIASLPAE